MFIFICLSALGLAAVYGASGQGIGDRNRASGGGSYNIMGRVRLPDGRPAVGVRISMTGAEFASGSATTDLEGAFVLSSVPAGNFTIMARAEGYQTESEMLTIAQGTTGGQSFQIFFNLRLPGQPKADKNSSNPLLKGVPKDAVSKYDKAVEKIAKKDYKGAQPLLDEAIAAYPNFAAAYYEKGSAYLKDNDLDKALESFVKAIQAKPDYLEAKYSVGYTQYLKKNYEVAAAVFDDVLKQKSDMPEAHMYLGISLYYLKNINAAEAQLKLAAGPKAGESTALAHRYLGGIYMQKKQNAEAAAELQKYLDLVPKAPDADKLKSTIADLKKQS
jgi:Tfp pilus assembly protein PilF